MSFQNNSIFWIEVHKISPNPFQPRRHFDEVKLKDLSDSIRQYGVLQPLVVTQRETRREDGGISVAYELIAGERRLRASKLAGLSQVPVIIKDDEDDEQMKLELAIIENLQREDISPIERAQAFGQLAKQFNLKHGEIAKKVGKSREYVSNTIRLLQLPEHMQQALAEGKMTEGHARPLLMLGDRKEEQETLFKEIIYTKMNVRDAEKISRRIATDRVRKHERKYDPEILELEKHVSENLGTRVRVEPRQVGGKILIDFMSDQDLKKILYVLNQEPQNTEQSSDDMGNQLEKTEMQESEFLQQETSEEGNDISTDAEKETGEESDGLYSLNNFSI